MSGWVQTGFVLISDISLQAGRTMPWFHAFAPGRWDIEVQYERAMADLPAHLRVNLRIVDAQLLFDGPSEDP